jgi:5'-nucleotidase
MEGTIMGRQSVAVSLCHQRHDSFKHNMSAALAAMAVLEHVLDNPLPTGVLLNVNVPNLLIKSIKGFMLTKRGHRRYVDKITSMKDPRGNDSYWIAGKTEEGCEEGTDVTAVNEGYVSVTPVRLDMTDYAFLDEMRSQGLDDKFAKAINLA